MYKLYYCAATSVDHDFTEVIVAETQEEATDKFSAMLEESESWYAGAFVYELEFENFEISIKKKL